MSTKNLPPEARKALFLAQWALYPEPLRKVLKTLAEWPHVRASNFAYLIGWTAAAQHYSGGNPGFEVGYCHALASSIDRGDPAPIEWVKEAP